MTTDTNIVENASRTMEDIEYLKIKLDFISNLMKYLTWPIFFLIIIFLIYLNRKKIKNLSPTFVAFLKSITSLSAAGISISFSDYLQEVNIEKSEFITPEEQNKSASNSDSPNNIDSIRELFTPEVEFRELVNLRPDYAVLNSFQTVEEYIQKLAGTQNKYTPIASILREMNKNKTISSGATQYILSLSKLRNNVVHNKNIQVSPDDAILYRENCVEAIQILAISELGMNT
ncbi:hypothetical protein [Enterococcus sp. DIV1297f]|uniref:hypothetical protein n=1 Tax=Enterococcus sp. DIV1297f TaxID=2774691 RepID=UPI003D2D3773